jgi:hypothetical protein
MMWAPDLILHYYSSAAFPSLDPLPVLALDLKKISYTVFMEAECATNVPPCLSSSLLWALSKRASVWGADLHNENKSKIPIRIDQLNWPWSSFHAGPYIWHKSQSRQNTNRGLEIVKQLKKGFVERGRGIKRNDQGSPGHQSIHKFLTIKN